MILLEAKRGRGRSTLKNQNSPHAPRVESGAFWELKFYSNQTVVLYRFHIFFQILNNIVVNSGFYEK